ncbi:hypothetical protein WMF18_03915 [Sorangium sp. So ce315]|uniref:hypothetical protein n=1 Tax=Sorangium sp. So ce315 TaxID=3133299 RepID=UPI003F631EF7
MYQLTILFDSADVSLLVQGGFKVVLRKSTADQDPANVIWLASGPVPQSVVQWGSDYGLYASRSTLDQGNIITKNASVGTAYPRQSYVFGSAFTFSGPQSDPTLQQGEYKITNNYTADPWVVFGMTQEIIVDGQTRTGHPLNGQIALTRMIAIFKPLEKITIYLSDQAADGMVTAKVGQATVVQGIPTTLTYSAGMSDIAVRYDRSLGGFVVQSSA